MRRLAYPVPEAIDGRPWRIEPGLPRCAPRDHAMWVPLDPDPQLAVIRAHEMAHARWTPRNARRPRVVPEIVANAVEDARVNYLAVQAGVDFSAGVPSTIQRAALTMAGGDWRRIAVMLTSSLDAADFQELATLARAREVPHVEHAIELASRARRMLGTRLPRAAGRPWTYARTLYVARWLSEQLGRPEPDPAVAPPPCGAPWGHMTIETPPLDRSALSRVVATAEGTHLRAPWRVTTDQGVFRTMRAPKRGTVLVDASGSMGLEPAEIAALARAVPAGLIAAYGGESDRGVLRILAVRGHVPSDRRAYDFSHYWMNVIDGPALRWLAAQPAPRIWVSDGIVTSIGDRLNAEAQKDAAQIVRTARITRVADVPEAIAMLRRR